MTFGPTRQKNMGRVLDGLYAAWNAGAMFQGQVSAAPQPQKSSQKETEMEGAGRHFGDPVLLSRNTCPWTTVL